jgi:hypothetical protein
MASASEVTLYKLKRFPRQKLLQLLDIDLERDSGVKPLASSSTTNIYPNAFQLFSTVWGTLSLEQLGQVFLDVNPDPSYLCVDAFGFLTGMGLDVIFNVALFDADPWTLFLKYIHYISALVPRDFNGLNNLANLWRCSKKPETEPDWSKIFTESLVICCETGVSLTRKNFESWRYSFNSLNLVSMEPITDTVIERYTTFNSLSRIYDTLKLFSQLKSGKKLTRLFNLDTPGLVNKSTWTKFKASDVTLGITSDVPLRFNLIKAILSNAHVRAGYEKILGCCLLVDPQPSPGTPSSSKARVKSLPPGGSKPVRVRIPPTTRQEIWDRDSMGSNRCRCFCCQTEVKFINFEAGHIVSVANHGDNSPANLKVICGPCNKSMGSMDMRTYCDQVFKHIPRKW